MGEDFGFGELAYRAPELLLFVGEGKVHRPSVMNASWSAQFLYTIGPDVTISAKSGEVPKEQGVW
jgi:hypothetical protein